MDRQEEILSDHFRMAPLQIHPNTFVQYYERALQSQDWTQVAPLMHPKVEVEFSTGQRFIGIQAVQVAFEGNFQLIENESFEITQVQFDQIGARRAKYRFHFHWSGYINNQLCKGHGTGHATLAYVKGRWLLREEVLKA